MEECPAHQRIRWSGDLDDLTRHGFRPSKIAYLSWHAWNDAETGAWPPNIPAASHRAYELAEIKKWLRNFSSRFFTSQFKRTAMPNGTKISSGSSLSLRGDWRRPPTPGRRCGLPNWRAAFQMPSPREGRPIQAYGGLRIVKDRLCSPADPEGHSSR